MSWALPPSSATEKAWRRKAYQKLARLVKRVPGPEPPLLEFDEARRRLHAFQATYVGVKPIPVKQIIGTVDRSKDFDRDFLPRRPELRARYRNMERLFAEGEFPPIVVYELGNAYFVVDGHHRVAIAKQRGVEMIDAEITRLRTRVKLPPDADIGQIILAEQERLFLEKSGLAQARPDVLIELSRADDYVELLELVKVHGFHLLMERGQVLPLAEIGGDWYDRVYQPAIEAIRKERLPASFPNASEADLFLWVHRRRRTLFPERGDMTFETAVQMTREEQTQRKKPLTYRAVKKLNPLASDG